MGLEFADALVSPSRPVVFEFEVWIHAAEALESQVCEEVHAVMARAVYEQLEGIDSALHEAEHTGGRAPLEVACRMRFAVFDREHLADLRGVERAVAALYAVAKGVDCSACYLVDWSPGVFQAHGGFVEP